MKWDPDTIYGPCSICGAVQTGAWPHPLGEPCPQKVLIDSAYIDRLDAERGYYLRAGIAAEQGMPEIADTFRRMMGKDDDD